MVKTAAEAALSTDSMTMIKKIRLALDEIEKDVTDLVRPRHSLAEFYAEIVRDNAMILLECIRQDR